jgi:carboxymethylenebutenolidase
MNTQHKDLTLGQLPAYHVYPDDGGAHPGVIVIHEIWGLTDHIKDVADRLAQAGYSVVAPNLFYGMPFEGKIDQSLLQEMHDPQKRDEAQKKMREVMAPISVPEFAAQAVADLKRCADYLLADHNVTGRVAVMGFCFGGSYAYHLAAQDGRIQAAVPFYGQPAAAEEVGRINCPVLAFYGDQDVNLMQSLPALRENMKNHGKTFEAVVYSGTGHAFFNDTNARMHHPEYAKDAWQKTLAFLAQAIG